MRTTHRGFPGLLILAGLLGLIGQSGGAEPARATSDQERLAWWQDARFGMFIHWGPVSLKGTEIGWSRGAEVPIEEYDNLYRRFNPTNFDAAAWAQTAADAGMKYLVFTTKHHDGFCNWDTKQTDYSIMHSPFGRDVVKELAEQCKRHQIRFCTYHSICDWHHPDYPLGSPGGKSKKPNPNMDRYNGYLKAQLTELIQNYGPLGILWFDGEWEAPWTVERGEDLYQFCRKLQPSLIINNRVSKGRAGMAGTTVGNAPGDYDTPEQRIGAYQDARPWETCMTICQQWAWKPDDRMKSLDECLQTLIRCAGGDGNLLFNVGPMPDGRIEPRQVARLLEMGAWLKRYGETIYGTRGGPWKPTRTLASTRKGNVVYAHVLRFNEGPLVLPGINKKIIRSSLLTGGEATVTQTESGVEVIVPRSAQRPIDTIIKLELDGPAMDVPAVQAPTEFKTTASNVFQNMEEFGADKAFDRDMETRWATDAGTKQAWVAVEFPKPTTASSVRIREAYAGRVKKFEVQCKEGASWKVVFAGDGLGEDFSRRFEPVTAREFRLNILEATEGPTISEIEFGK